MTRPSRPSRPTPASTIAKLVGILVVAAVLVAGATLPFVGGAGLAAKNESDKFLNTTCDFQEATPPEGTTIEAKDGTVLARIFTQNRQPVPLAQIPKFMQQALIDTEDRRFYQHHGVDMRGLLRSAFSTSNGDTQGGSTLTMQYVKQSRYYNDIGNLAKQNADISQTLSRKMQDAKCAIDLEKHETKAQILDNYFNIAAFGENAYSVQSAAETYFNTTVSKLTVPEAALLVGMLRAPTDYDPFKAPQAAKTRRDEVLDNMAAAGDLTAAQAATYKATPIKLGTASPPSVQQGCYNAPQVVANIGFFCQYVENWLEQNQGLTQTEISTKGYTVVTTLDPAIQQAAQTKLSSEFPAAGPLTAAMPVVDPKTGDVLAMVASKPFGSDTSLNQISNDIFTDYDARSASTYKYFTMIAALEVGAQPNLQLSANSKSGPLTYTTQHCSPFTANNGDQSQNYLTTETLQSAIAKSSNTYFVGLEDQLFGECNLDPILSVAKSLGFNALNQVDPSSKKKQTYATEIDNNQQATLTEGEYPTSPLELTGAYAAAANDGIYCTPAPIISITDVSGKPVAVKRTPCATEMTPFVARTAMQLLQGDTQSGGTSANVFAPWYNNGGAPIVGKTGTDTVNNAAGAALNTSFWFVGMTPDIAATMTVFNVTNPLAPITNFPGATDQVAQTTLDASVAAQYWYDGLEPTLAAQSQAGGWQLQSPTAIPNGQPVPNVLGLTQAAAATQLQQSGFKLAAASSQCGSSENYLSVGYYSPQYAAPGSTVTVCISNGQAPYVFTPPIVRPVNPPRSSAPAAPTPPPAATPPARTTGPRH